MKKIVLFILALFFLIPSAFAEDLEVVSYQKLKNITKQDNPAGSNLTMGFTGDEIRFLVFIQNKSEQKITFRVEDILPENLIYKPGTTACYQLGSGGTWYQIEDKNDEFPLDDYFISIESEVGCYFKFSTIVSDDIPANNLTLSNFVNIYNSANKIIKQTVTKVLVPNSTVQQVKAKTPSVAEEDYVNKILKEEQEFIEKTFFELEENGFEADLPQKVVLNYGGKQRLDKREDQRIKIDSLEFDKIVACIVVLVLLILLLFYFQKKFGGNDYKDSKF